MFEYSNSKNLNDPNFYYNIIFGLRPGGYGATARLGCDSRINPFIVPTTRWAVFGAINCYPIIIYYQKVLTAQIL